MSVATATKYRPYCRKCLDFHAHFCHPEVFASGQKHSVSSCFGARPLDPSLPMVQRMFHPELHIEGMDAVGIDVHLLSSADVVQSRAWAGPAEEARLAALVNDECLRWVQRHPTRFVGSAVLPLGDMKMALAELERAVAAGLRVLNLPSNHHGVYLGAARFEALWCAIEQHGLVTFIHPDGVTDPWFQDYAMWNSIGQSIEEVRVMTSLIYEGVMDRHRGLKIVMAHGGGYMPHYMGRLDRNYTDKPFTGVNLSKKPSAYLQDFYYDSCVYDPRTLELLIERVGIDRIVLGGDYPVATEDPLQLLEATRLSDAQRAQIAGGNAIELLQLAI